MLTPQGRRDCDFSVNPGPSSCLDGGCNGGLECDESSGTVSDPFDLLALLSELTLLTRVFPRLPLPNLPWMVLMALTITTVCGQLNVVTGFADMLFHLLMDLICRCRSQTPQDAPLHHALKILARVVSILSSRIEYRLKFGQAPMDSRVRLTLVDSLWDARATVKSIPTRATHQAVVRVLSAPRQPARVLGSLITPISVRLILLLEVYCVIHRDAESNCPNSNVYAYDDSALWTCQASINADYTITFCP